MLPSFPLPPCAGCGAAPGSSLACLECGTVLDEVAGAHHFARFGLAPSTSVDGDDLELRYLRLSRALHPDFQASATAEVQALALRNSALLNEARQVLDDEQPRAEYLLGLHDIDALERNKALDPGFLMESLELSEEVEQARADGDGETLETIAENCRSEIARRLDAATIGLASDAPDIDALAVLLNETRVYKRILRDTESPHT